MNERREFPEKPPPERLDRWVAWLHHHTIFDEQAVSIPGWVERREEARQIVYTIWDPDVPNCDLEDPITGECRLSTVVVQLESVPSPFPD